MHRRTELVDECLHRCKLILLILQLPLDTRWLLSPCHLLLVLRLARLEPLQRVAALLVDALPVSLELAHACREAFVASLCFLRVRVRSAELG